MKRYSFAILLLCLILIALPAYGAGDEFQYKLKPGQTWIVKDNTQVESEAMGYKGTTRTKRTLKYVVEAGPKSGWVSLTAMVTSLTSKTDDDPSTPQNVFEGMVFKADLHKSGEVRNYSYSGGDPQMAKFTGPMMEPAMFWFPEFPDYPLSVGDEFEVRIKTATPGMEGMGGVGEMKRVTKDVYTLEDVKDGLAYFSIKSRTKMDASGMDVKVAAKGEAVFDMREGMWVEANTKSKSAMPGMNGEAITIQKLEIEKQ